MKPDLYAAIKNLEEVNRMIVNETPSYFDLYQLAAVLIKFINDNAVSMDNVK